MGSTNSDGEADASAETAQNIIDGLIVSNDEIENVPTNLSKAMAHGKQTFAHLETLTEHENTHSEV